MDTKLATIPIRTKQWASIIQDCRSSGLKVDDYCEQYSLSRNAYYYWQRKVKEAALSQAGFVEIQDTLKAETGLAAMANTSFGLNPTEPDSIFLVCGRRNDRMKTLLYEGDGWVLCYKRFADGHLQWPSNEKEAKAITGQQYRWLMDSLAIEQKKTISQVELKVY